MNLKGWDIISLTPLGNMNRAIADNWKDLPFSIQKGDLKLYGVFGTWNIINGGSGKILRMACPIKRGIFLTDHVKLKLDGMTAIFNIMLNFFDITTESGENVEKNTLKLKFDFRIPGYLPKKEEVKNGLAEDTGGVVQAIELKNCSSVFKYTILNMFVDFIISNSHSIQTVFASVVLNGNHGNWLSPVLCRYSYLDGPNPHIAILAVCTNRDISKLPLDVDIAGMTLNKQDSYYAVSKALFTKNIGIPCFTTLFRSVPTDYEMSGDVLRNIPRVFMPDIRAGAIDYSPYVNAGSANISITGSTLNVNLDNGGCDLYAGINMNWSSYHSFSCEYRDKKLFFTKRSENFWHDEDIPWYLRFIPLSFIIDICVHFISDSLASSIAVKIDINSAALNDIRWYGAGTDIKDAFLNEGFVIKF